MITTAPSGITSMNASAGASRKESKGVVDFFGRCEASGEGRAGFSRQAMEDSFGLDLEAKRGGV